ncbi:MAG: hypothetical protein ACRDRL_05335 [Sciscionella sp.]
MYAVSAIIDSARDQFPPINQWPFQQVVDMTKAIELLTQIDKKLGAKDCVDEKKDKFIKQLQRRIVKLEAQRGKRKKNG